MVEAGEAGQVIVPVSALAALAESVVPADPDLGPFPVPVPALAPVLAPVPDPAHSAQPAAAAAVPVASAESASCFAGASYGARTPGGTSHTP